MCWFPGYECEDDRRVCGTWISPARSVRSIVSTIFDRDTLTTQRSEWLTEQPGRSIPFVPEPVKIVSPDIDYLISSHLLRCLMNWKNPYNECHNANWQNNCTCLQSLDVEKQECGTSAGIRWSCGRQAVHILPKKNTHRIGLKCQNENWYRCATSERGWQHAVKTSNFPKAVNHMTIFRHRPCMIAFANEKEWPVNKLSMIPL
jgi:hypothetical protein